MLGPAGMSGGREAGGGRGPSSPRPQQQTERRSVADGAPARDFPGVAISASAVHVFLDVVSATSVPFASEIAGLASGVWYAWEGDWVGAGSAVAGVVPMVGTAADATRVTRATALPNDARLTLFKWGRESSTRSTGWADGDVMLFLPNRGSPKANWSQNSSHLREVMRAKRPISDSYRNPATGEQFPARGFLQAERKLLESSGWQYNPATGAYHPPGP